MPKGARDEVQKEKPLRKEEEIGRDEFQLEDQERRNEKAN